jgi:phosphate acetyltransferase
MKLHPAQETWHSAARADPRPILLPESEDERVLAAAEVVAREGLARPFLLGEPARIRGAARAAGVGLDGVGILDLGEQAERDDLVELFVAESDRRGKPASAKTARKLLERPLYLSSLLLRAGEFHGLVAGAAHASADVLRPAFFLVGRPEDRGVVSSAFLVLVPDPRYGEQGLFLVSDPAVVPEPTVEELADIAIATADTARILLGVEPRVAMLSFSTYGSSTHPQAKKMGDATRRLRQLRPDLLVDGEMQIDAALVPDVGRRKAPDSPVAGRANVLIFPDLSSANMVLKTMERLGGAASFGGLLQGLRRPMSDVSRGVSVPDLVQIVVLTALTEALA